MTDLVLSPGVTLAVPEGVFLIVPERFKLEIQESTVTPKLSEAPKPAEKTVVVEKKTVIGKMVTEKASGGRLAARGDSGAAFAVAAVLLGCTFIAGAGFA